MIKRLTGELQPAEKRVENMERLVSGFSWLRKRLTTSCAACAVLNVGLANYWQDGPMHRSLRPSAASRCAP